MLCRFLRCRTGNRHSDFELLMVSNSPPTTFSACIRSSEPREGAPRLSRHPASQVELFVTPVADDDYDFALARSPHLCRPLAAAMGDLRPARQCRADHAADLARRLPAPSSPEIAALYAVAAEGFL